MDPTLALWVSNVMVCSIVAVNTIAWGKLRALGSPTLSLSFVRRLFFQRWFLLIQALGLVGAFARYVAQSTIGVGKGNLFYYTGNIVLLIVAKYRLKEGFTLTQLAGIGLVLLGAFLVT